MDQPAGLGSATQKVFQHALYEYRKGVRPLFMMTMAVAEANRAIDALTAASIDHYIHAVTDSKVNLFFGKAGAVAMMSRIIIKPLHQLSAEEDFIVGVLLGYDKEEQCRRFLARSTE